VSTIYSHRTSGAELIRHEETGLLIDPADPAAIADGRACSATRPRVTLGAAGRRDVEIARGRRPCANEVFYRDCRRLRASACVDERRTRIVTTSPAEMSVVIVTPDVYETIAKTMRHAHAIGAPTARGRGRGAQGGGRRARPADTADTFAAVRIVEAGPIRSLAHGNAVGIRAATAPIVALPRIIPIPTRSGPSTRSSVTASHGLRSRRFSTIRIAQCDQLGGFPRGVPTWSAPRPSGRSTTCRPTTGPMLTC
jgi:hypothetical protein